MQRDHASLPVGTVDSAVRSPNSTIATLIGVALLAVVVVVTWSAEMTTTWDSFSKVAGVWIPIVVSLVAATASFLVAHRQQAANARLEELKTELLARLEAIKGKIVAERKAYDELHAAAIFYYYTLATLENGKLTSARMEKAEDAALSACRYTAFVPSQHRDKWMQFWQAARSLSEKAMTNTNAQQQAALWKSDVALVSAPFLEFEAVVRSAHENA